MTISELLNITDYKKVFNYLYQVYYKDKRYQREDLMDVDASYNRVFEQLKKIKPSKNKDLNELKIYIATIPDSELQNIDVCLYDEDKDELFSMDFVDWKDLINLEIYKTIKMENFQILAHFLWQITFWGFSMEEINAQAQKTKDAANESVQFIDA